MDKFDDPYKFRLARYLLNYDENIVNGDLDSFEYQVDIHLYTDQLILHEINEILAKLRVATRPGLSGFNTFMQTHIEHGQVEREEKSELLEEHHTYDKYILADLREFLCITIALLVKLERMHKKNVLCGMINPYTFMYSKKNRTCDPYNLGVVLSDKNSVRAEKQKFGPYIYLTTNLSSIPYNNYLAPELKETVRIYHLQRRLKELVYEAQNRNIKLTQENEILNALRDFHQKQVKYTNRAEIYSVGYTINQILSHTLSKLAHLGMLINEFPKDEVPEEVVHEADLLLPHAFANPVQERITELLNEAIEYIHDLMQEHMEKRDSLQLSIEKFTSLLKRTGLVKPESMLDEEEEHEAEAILEELKEFIEGVEEGEEGEEEEHEHEEHEHAEHEHEEHEHEEHEHEEHEHAEHEHEEHEHEEHEHEEHEHEEHEHEEHEHEEHEHEEHEHEEHEHEEHEHEEHEHEEHEHEEHEHEEHEHEEHEHEHEEHEHEEHEHEEHEHEHEEHEHEEHEHEEHEHEEHEHEEHEHEEHHEHEGAHATDHETSFDESYDPTRAPRTTRLTPGGPGGH
jgi:hypothetical protein